MDPFFNEQLFSTLLVSLGVVENSKVENSSIKNIFSYHLNIYLLFEQVRMNEIIIIIYIHIFVYYFVFAAVGDTLDGICGRVIEFSMIN